MMTEQEEFEFRLRLEAEQAAPAVPSAPTSEPSILEQMDRGSIASRIKAGTILYPEEETALRQTLQSAASGPLMGAVQVGAELLGNKDLAEKIAKNKREGNIVGSILQPEAWLMGGPLSKLTGTAKQALGLGASGAAYGAASAAGATGVEGARERMDAAEISGLVGAAIPGAGRLITELTPKAKNVAKSLLAIFSKGGRTSVGQKMVLDQLTPEERIAVLNILNKQGVDTSALGTPLTAGETLAKNRIGAEVQSPEGAGVASLESVLSRMPGGEQLRQKAAERAAAIRGTLDTLSGGRGAAVDPLLGMSADDVALAEARTARSKTGGMLYPKGEVSGDAALDAIMQKPGVRSAMGIDELSAANAGRPTQIGIRKPQDTLMNSPVEYEKYSIKSLQNQYRLMDKEINRLMKTGVSMDETRARELMKAKGDLGEWLTAASPEWAQANRMFASQSRPVRQMEVGAALKAKMEQSPTAFRKATENLSAQEQLIRKVTGRPDVALTDVFNLGQMSKIKGLENEAQITEEVTKLGDLVRAQMGDEAAFQLPNLLNIWVAIANKVAKTSAAATVDDVTRAAADVVANPNKLRMLLAEDARNMATAKLPMTAERIRKLAPISAVSGGMLSGE